MIWLVQMVAEKLVVIAVNLLLPVHVVTDAVRIVIIAVLVDAHLNVRIIVPQIAPFHVQMTVKMDAKELAGFSVVTIVQVNVQVNVAVVEITVLVDALAVVPAAVAVDANPIVRVAVRAAQVAEVDVSVVAPVLLHIIY